MKHLILTAALVALTATGAHAQQMQKKQMRSELSAPIVMFTPLVKKHADALQLTAEQRADLQQWLATRPAKRKALEAEAIAARAALRDAIIAGAPVEDRQKLAAAVGDYEAKLVMARSHCTDHWRATLTAEQFAQLLQIAAAN